MATPSEKAPVIESLLSSLVKTSRSDSIKKDTCVMCSQPAVLFRDKLSCKEFTISGLCQVCQDKIFGVEEY